jgi:hypothetical protein
MKEKIRTFLNLSMVVVFLFILSCYQPECSDPRQAKILLTLTDSNDSVLIGKKYDPDSIRLSINNSRLYIYITKGVIVLNYYDWIKYNPEDYILYLSKEDQDTMNLSIRTEFYEECGGYNYIDSLLYNHKLIYPVYTPKKPPNYKVIKQ